MRIREARIKRNITVQEAADYLCCDTTTYTRYEIGKRQPSIEILVSLSRLFKVSVDYLIESDMIVDTSITEEEARMVEAMRRADERACADAMALLQLHVNK